MVNKQPEESVNISSRWPTSFSSSYFILKKKEEEAEKEREKNELSGVKRIY